MELEQSKPYRQQDLRLLVSFSVVPSTGKVACVGIGINSASCGANGVFSGAGFAIPGAWQESFLPPAAVPSAGNGSGTWRTAVHS